MTPADHNKVIGIMHLIYGGFFALISVLMLVVFGAILIPLLDQMPKDPNAPPMEFFWAIFAFVTVFYVLMSIPALLAGYAMLKKKSWARIAGIVSSVIACMSFPFGTALAVYSFWYFFGEAGKAYDRSLSGTDWRGALNQPQPQQWYAQTYGHERERQPQQQTYRPPQQPPSWRDET